MKKAIFLDFYGTVVFEDGENISKITKIISETGDSSDPSTIGGYWWDVFYRSFVDSYGETFHTQRDIEQESLAKTIEYFKSTANAEELSNEMFEYTLKLTGLQPEDVVHIGDSLSSDVKGASSLGIDTIWVNRGNRPVPEGVCAVGNLLEIFETEYL